ncbi:hypothetical protein C3L33_03360, partial [Rhododendron williamsianum]
MGTLRAPPPLHPCTSFLNSPETTPKSCAASFLRQGKTKIGYLALRRSLADGNKNNGGVRSMQDGSSIIEGGKKARVFSWTRRGMQSLAPLLGDSKVIDSKDKLATDREEVAEVIGGEGKVLTRVTHSIVFVTAEAAPYSKTGGLGDVCGSLPTALAARGHRVMVVSPRYLHGGPSDKKFAGASEVGSPTKIYCFGGEQEVGFFHEFRAGVDWVFVDHPSYHRPGNPYGDIFVVDSRNSEGILCLKSGSRLMLPFPASRCLTKIGKCDMVELKTFQFPCIGLVSIVNVVLGVDFVAIIPGVEPAASYNNLGLPLEWYGAVEWVFPTWARTHALDTGKAVNVLKGAIVTADRILTVSQGYAWEITTAEGGYGLDELLSSRKSVLNGITNGVDAAEWNPSLDEHIPSNYSIHDLSGKVECKIALQKELGLPIRPDCPLIGFIGRLDYQKGIDIILSATPELMEEDIQFVMLGSGERQYEDWMRVTEAHYRDKYRGWVGFNVPISHRITAGCDILLMPSRFEPCGLNQLYAMRYGTVPVVHGTGGLRDTVENFNPYARESLGEGTGHNLAFKSQMADHQMCSSYLVCFMSEAACGK